MEHVNFNEIIDDLKRRTKAGELPREVRIAEIDRVTEDWFARTGKLPDAKQLERLADLILHEELTDPDIHKVAHNEYPFLSEHQFDRRDNRESVVGEAIDNSAADGKKHTPPTRKIRTAYENNFVDKKAKSRNVERKKRYKEFTKVQPVITYNVGGVQSER
jgi:hypothetical protein